MKRFMYTMLLPATAAIALGVIAKSTGGEMIIMCLILQSSAFEEWRRKYGK